MKLNLSSGNDYDKRQSVPTLRQYLKGLGNKKLASSHVVQVIWKPGKFSNYTFETERFRVRVKCDSQLGEALEGIFEELEASQPCLAITDIDRNAATFSITTLDNERVRWTPLGDSGYRVEHL